ncbi:MAG TPA: hypothetical protein VKP69_16885 [Isosphaeraceae bacterium]|nr:hypothetical protein [Isosphaeraceae bacterium]
MIALTPAPVADAIPADRRRRILHDLPTARPSSRSIVLGKAAARLVNVGTFLALVLPIARLLTLFGGKAPCDIPLSNEWRTGP